MCNRHHNSLNEEGTPPIQPIVVGNIFTPPGPLSPMSSPPYTGASRFLREIELIRDVILQLHLRFIQSAWNPMWLRFLIRLGGFSPLIDGIKGWLDILHQGDLYHSEEYDRLSEFFQMADEFGVDEQILWHLLVLRRLIPVSPIFIFMSLYIYTYTCTHIYPII